MSFLFTEGLCKLFHHKPKLSIADELMNAATNNNWEMSGQPIEQGSANFSYKGPDRKYIRLCELHSFCHNCSPLPL